ncbi:MULTISPECIES: YrzI family small protein [Bacillus]|uniref:Sporulation protein n=1 Tax=Bacillus paramycoides TaxID=2026194 RepID=A0A1J9UGT6_9BACI|nr:MULTISPECIES: YrzI family small protein [Bacillus]PFD39166.1 YrzI family protein [Bacillus cereus]MED0960827.1 YrzI family small protein [Bacillus paramycoides]MED0963631.1 YrzI family small protein [Bacillus paramycoides]MED0970568.1 YrzI family small protein [Bacillus paramycoides]MED0982058.1 YrzI family small protein [Bacillus paramycoides]
MKFKAFFLTITIQKRKFTKDELLREQHIKNIMDEVKERQSSYYNRLY